MPPPPLRDLIDESLDEASFLLRRWEAELASLTRSLDEVWSWTEERLHGALDGVRIAGSDLVAVASAGLGSGDPDRIVVCAGLLAASDEPPGLDGLTTALATAEGPTLDAMVRGLELLASDRGLVTATDALHRRGALGLMCRLKAFRRVVTTGDVRTALASESPLEQCEAMRAARHLPAGEGDELIIEGLDSSDPVVRAAAIESGIARGMRPAWDSAKAAVDALPADAGPYLRMLAIFGSAAEHETVYDALGVAALQRHAAWAVGHIGTVRAVDVCIAGLENEPVARACGEAYAWITGANLDRDRLSRVDPPPDSPPFEEDDLEANLVPAPDEQWPLPDPDAVRQDWAARRDRFATDVRYIAGQPVTTDTIPAAVETGPMLRRPDLILEMSARTRGRYDVESRAFAARQRQMMAAARAALLARVGR